MLHGAALATLPWLHTRFAVLAATLGGMILVRLARAPRAVPKAIAFLSIPAVSAIAWLFFFAVTYGTPDPSAPYGGRVENAFAYFDNGIGGLLFDQGFGLFATAPVLAFALLGFARARRLALDLAVVAVPYVLAVATFAMWWAGWSGPARFLVPLVLTLAVPAACAWQAATGRAARAVLLTALVVTVWISGLAVLGGGGRLAYHARNEGGMTAAPWMDWATGVVDLPAALPAFVPLPVGTAVESRHAAARAGFSVTAVWVVCLGAAMFGIWGLFRLKIFRLEPEATRLSVRVTSAPVSAFAFGIAVMIAAPLSWRIAGVEPVTTARAQLELLRATTGPRAVVVDLTGRRRLALDAVAPRMRIAVDVPPRRVAGGRLGRPLATFAALPAGEYELGATAAPGDGWMMAGVGNEQFAIVTQPLAAFASGITLRLPVDVRALVVRGDELARDRVTSVELRPARVSGMPVADGAARRAVRYGSTTAYFMDDRSFAEPATFWVGGGRVSSIVFAPDEPRPSVRLVVRNGAVANTVKIGNDTRSLAPGEEWMVDVPVDGARGAALVTIDAAAGFRPSELDPRSRDTRYLGVNVRLP